MGSHLIDPRDIGGGARRVGGGEPDLVDRGVALDLEGGQNGAGGNIRIAVPAVDVNLRNSLVAAEVDGEDGRRVADAPRAR